MAYSGRYRVKNPKVINIGVVHDIGVSDYSRQYKGSILCPAKIFIPVPNAEFLPNLMQADVVLVQPKGVTRKKVGVNN